MNIENFKKGFLAAALAVAVLGTAAVGECRDSSAISLARQGIFSAGGKGYVADLPKEGIYGNDHFMFQDLNNDVIARHVEKWLKENV
jgi:hypothetical protein